jgi:hypothetical protein
MECCANGQEEFELWHGLCSPHESVPTKHGSEMSWRTNSDSCSSLHWGNLRGDTLHFLQASDLEIGRVASRSPPPSPDGSRQAARYPPLPTGNLGVYVSQQKFRGKEGTR